MSKVLILLCTLLIISSCRESYDTVEEYEKYIRSEEYPYLKTVVENGVKFQLRYMPADAMMITHYKHFEETKAKISLDSLLTKEVRDQRINEEVTRIKKTRDNYENALYFMLTIGYEDESKDLVYSSMQSGFSNYSNWLQKLLFSLNEYIYLQTPEIEEVPFSIYHMERNYGMMKTRNFLLSFPKEFNDIKILNSSNEEVKVVIDDFGFGTGKINFAFNIHDENSMDIKL
ncbi:MAG: hypothetical protein HND52_14960 [Ignavibacteriae bacterium]|nr:hypothetical protein [Ignavibacteriota bacterium]